MYSVSDCFDSLFDFYDYLFDGFDKYLYEYVLNRIMPRIITLQEKLSVIDAWLNGESRNDIAKKHNIGSGTVYNIVQEWGNDFGDANKPID